MNVWMRAAASGRERPGRAIDVAGRAAGERRDDRARHRLRHPPDGLRVGVRGDGEAGLEDVARPAISSCRASRTFSSIRIENPGACSPSRRVVSKMIRLFSSWDRQSERTAM